MIVEYHRPSTLESALELIGRKTPETKVLAGGTILNRKNDHPFAVVDIQDLPLKQITMDGNVLRMGAGVSLQMVIENHETPDLIKKACYRETSYNLRQMSTLGGCIGGGDGKSVLLAVLLAWNAQVELHPGNENIPVGEILPLRQKVLSKRLITAVSINLSAKSTYELVSKSPSDFPIAGAAMSQWPNGRTRVCVFGFGDHPLAAMDGSSSAGAEMAARNAFADSEDPHATAEYREKIAPVLVERCLANLSGEAI